MKRFPAQRPDAIVIGASIGGLAAAACLAEAGKRVLVLERQAAPPEPVGPLFALDPVLVSQLRLGKRGLSFVQRDLALALPGPERDAILITRDRHQTARALGALAEADGANWSAFRREVFGLARNLRRWWWNGLEQGEAAALLDGARTRTRFQRVCFMGADAFLAEHFQSDALAAALLFDASEGGFHVSEPGSALALVWRAAQEMAGLQGATALPAPGTLVWSLIKAAGQSNFRCCATVTGLLQRGAAVTGVRLEDGEEIESGMVFSSLSQPATLRLAGAPRPDPRIAEARIALRFRQPIAFPPGRLILAERPGIYADAHEAARAGKLPSELPMAFVATAPDRIAATLRPLPARLTEEDRVQLAARALYALSRQCPGAAGQVRDVTIDVRSFAVRASLGHLLAPSIARVRSKFTGLYFCGDDAEPLPSPSGRAARLAVQFALKS